MSMRSNGVLRVTRTVANGEGDWAEVPPAIRDAIVMALTQSSPHPLRRSEGSQPAVGAGALVQTAPSYVAASASPSALTEGNVQSSIQTFDDAAWVRDTAVRSYAEFHNNIESLHAAMRGQLHPVWKTAMQLRPDILADVRDQLQLRRTDAIPDGVPITAATAQHIAQQELILDEVEDTLQMLRNTSVRFAAHFLSDEEKISMGANPAYLRAPDIDREVVESHTQNSLSAPLATPTKSHHRASHSRPTGVLEDDGLVNSKSSRRGHRGSNTGTTAPPVPNSPSQRHRHGRSHHDGDERRSSSTGQTSAAAIGDPLLEELRQQYQQRMVELEKNHRRTSTEMRQGTWPQVGSVASNRSSQSSSSRSPKNRRPSS